MVASEHKPLRLKAIDVDDLSVIATMAQDALVPIGDIAFLPDVGSFVMALNRFRWETLSPAPKGGEKTGERVHAGLRFDTVKRVTYHDIDRKDRGRYLELLTITCDEGAVVLHFAGGGAIRLEIEKLACALSDLDEPWPTLWTPEHGEE